MTTQPNFHNYGKYSSDNYGAHTLCFTDPQGNNFYYSYQTLVAYRKSGGSIVVRQNDWGTTTGKHLNWIDGGRKAERLSADDFAAKLKADFN